MSTGQRLRRRNQARHRRRNWSLLGLSADREKTLGENPRFESPVGAAGEQKGERRVCPRSRTVFC